MPCSFPITSPIGIPFINEQISVAAAIELHVFDFAVFCLNVEGLTASAFGAIRIFHCNFVL